MTNKFLFVPIVGCLISMMSCAQEKEIVEDKPTNVVIQQEATVKQEPHRYGGWYCPDNLYGFPAVDINNWQNVPVVNGRMPTKGEVETEASLIFVDMVKHPNAHAIDITLPKLASVYNQSTRRQDLIIVIQAFNINDDSIVGYRFLNGGNGSARLNEVHFLSEEDIQDIPRTQFVTQDITIKADPSKIWDVLTRIEYAKALQPIFDKNNTLKSDWRQLSNVNYGYAKAGSSSAKYADVLYGNYYIQNDYMDNLYSEKFFLTRDEETNTTTLKMVCGPFKDDYTTQRKGLMAWGKKVKELSEH